MPFVHRVCRAIREIRRATQCTHPQALREVLNQLESDNEGIANNGGDIKACVQRLGQGFCQSYYDAALRRA